MSRTIEQILEDIKFQFNDTVLENAANNKGTLYSLIRGMAIACYNQEQIIETLINSRQVTTASGLDLDLFANNYGIIRRQGISSFGSVLIKTSSEVVVPKGTLLQTQNGQLTFQTNKAVTVPSNREVSVEISSITKSFDTNLSSQTVLISPQYPKLYIEVGSFRDSANAVIGSLVGGSSSESDNSLRTRLSTYINNKGIVTPSSIKAIIQNYVSDAYFVEGRPAAGYTTVYVNTQDQLTLDLLTNKLEEIKALGVLVIIKPIQYQRVDLNIEVLYTSSTTDTLTTISNNVKQAVNLYFNNLTIGQTLNVNELSIFISSFTGYYNKITKPSTNITPLIAEYLLIPNEVTINVKSK